LHARQAADHEAARGLQEDEGREVLAGRVSRRLRAARFSADQDRAARSARQRFTYSMTSNSFEHKLNLQLVEKHDDGVTMEFDLLPGYLNSQGNLHGGVTASLADEAAWH